MNEPYIIAAYFVFWFFIFIYLLILGLKFNVLSRKVSQLEKVLKDTTNIQ